MDSAEKIAKVQVPDLKIIRYPDPRLREVCGEVACVDDKLRQIAARMFELMFAARGVGLAAPQIGTTVRMFVASPTFEEDDRRVYINPRITQVDGTQDGDEGCLSFPGISSRVKRYNFATIQAMDLDGNIFEETGEELAARIFQHELDHLNGTLLVDRMGSVAKLANRRALKDLEEEFAK